MKLPKILIVNGSPNPDGLGTRLAAIASEQLTENNNEVIIYNQFEKKFESCRGCLNCFNNGICPLNDIDGYDFDKQMLESDGILFLCPTYMHQMPGALKTSFDRFAYRMHEFPLLGKKVVMLVYAISNGADELSTFMSGIFRSMGAQVISSMPTYTCRIDEQTIIEQMVPKLEDMSTRIKQNNFAVTKNQEDLFKYIRNIVEAEIKNGFQSFKQNRWKDLLEYDSLVDYLRATALR